MRMGDVQPLKIRRIQAGLTQIEVAEALDISQQLLSKMERGLVKLTPARAQVLARILHCNAAELLPELALTAQPATESAQELDLLKAFRSLTGPQKDLLLGQAALMIEQNEKAGLPRVNAN